MIHTENTQPDTDKKSSWQSELIQWAAVLIGAIILAVLINSFVIVNAQIPSGSMENTIMTGEETGNNVSGAGNVGGLVGRRVSALLYGLVDVDALLGYARTLLLCAVAMRLGGFLLALLAALLLRFFLRTGALVERVEVDLSEHVHLRGELLLALKGEYLVLIGGGHGLRSAVFRLN